MDATNVRDEEWRGLIDYPGYEVSNLWRVSSSRRPCRRISLFNRSPRLLKPYDGPGGYLAVTVVGKTRRRVFIHSLVLLAFHGPMPFPGAVCRHLDGNRLNNAPGNLLWGTSSENSLDTVRHGRGMIVPGEKNGKAKLAKDDVELIRHLHASGESGASIARTYGVTTGTIHYIVRRKTWKHIA